MLLTPVESVIGVLMNAVSRHFEYQADKFACTLHEKLAPAAESLKGLSYSLVTYDSLIYINVDRKEVEEMQDMGDRLGKALITLHVKNLSTVWVDWLYVYSPLLFPCVSQ